MRLAVLMLCAGCNQLYGLDETRLRDAAPPFVFPDGAVIITPPPGPTTCGAPPPFEAWSYAQVAIDAVDLSLYGGQAITLGPSRRDLFDVSLATGVATRIPIDLPTSSEFRDPSISPDGSVLWFRQTIASQGQFVATRAGNWQKARETFGFPDPFNIEIGTPGFHDGTVRMVLALQTENGAPVRLVELSSPDGLVWTKLDTITFDQAALPGIISSPHLSADGCYLMFSTVAVIPYEMYGVPRDAAKQFSAAPTKLVKAVATGMYPIQPTLAPDQRSLWLFAQTAGGTSLEYRPFRGQ